jgi:hypothetical protein
LKQTPLLITKCWLAGRIIRRNPGSAKGNVVVMAHMLGALETIVTLTAGHDRRQTLHEQAQWISELAHRSLDSARNRAAIGIRLASLSATLEEKPQEGYR